MQPLLPIHILAGVLGPVSGAAALALWDGPDANAIGGLTAAYLVITALTTVRPVTPACVGWISAPRCSGCRSA